MTRTITCSWKQRFCSGLCAIVIVGATAAIGVHAPRAEEARGHARAMMYTAGQLSGCDDYHCLKCSSRDFCSTGGSCRHPDCGHQHAVVECHGCSIFYVRASAGWLSCLARAQHAAAAMNATLSLDDPAQCKFLVKATAQGPEIWFSREGTAYQERVIRVTSADVAGYRYRAGVIPMSHPEDAVDDMLVAQWWAAILQDHYDAMVLGVAPSRTVHTHCGKPLLKAYAEARKVAQEGPIPMAVWAEVFGEKLSPTDRDRLSLVAQIVPRSFHGGRASFTGSKPE